MTDDLIQTALRRAVHLLQQTGREGVVVGGLAVSAWGRPRMTQDVDVVVDIPKEGMEDFLRTARNQGYTFSEEDATELLAGGFLRLIPTHTDAPFPLDILLADTELHQSCLARKIDIQIGGVHVAVVAPEELILMKLVSFRPQDTFDLETVIEEMKGQLDLQHLYAWADHLGVREKLDVFLEEWPEDET